MTEYLKEPPIDIIVMFYDYIEYIKNIHILEVENSTKIRL